MSIEFPDLPWKVMPDGLLLSVRATPKGGRDCIDGIETLADGHIVLKARVRAAPADGEANAALTRVIAKAAGVAQSHVSLAKGDASRVKIFRLSGDPRSLAVAIEQTLKKARAK